ncbi:MULTISPECIES: LPXTG cell wall anchor domain-containing protein [unclassified Streptomyces]|uniref:LPXTG cell wall anchor domain-containing protein n=1 Tax=unclassified Streptomyces TaxID=2593676 RepID=UPI002E1D5777
MSRTSLLSVTACAMCPAAAPTERDRAMAAGGAPAGHGYHVALHTPSVFTAPVDYHPTALLIEAGSSDGGRYPAGIRVRGGGEESAYGRSVFWPEDSGRPMTGQHSLIPRSRAHISLNEGHPEGQAEGHPDGLPPTGTGPAGAELPGAVGQHSATPLTPPWRPAGGNDPAVINNASTWHAPEYVRIPGERCSYRPWNSALATGLTSVGDDVPEAAALPARSPAAPVPVPESRNGGTRTGSSVVWYVAGGALLLVIAGVLVRRRQR